MYKFRTMVVGAEDILQKKHIEEQTEIGREYIKHKKNKKMIQELLKLEKF